jgi:DNA-binding CsgD family transcriptional regulator
LTLLTGLLREASKGHGGCALIEGEPGIGKSSLMRAAVAKAPELGCQVFWGAGDELGQALPLLPFLDALRVRDRSAGLRRNMIVRLLRGEFAADRGADIPGVLAEQLLALVAEECAVQPAVLVIDDLQWADEASVALWGRLARMARQMPLLLAGTLRPVPQREDLLALRRMAEEGTRLPLAALSETAAADLVAALAGGRPDKDMLRLASGAAGNPLYLTELVAALARSSSLSVTETGAARLATASVPGSLTAAIADRLGFITAPVREVLRAAALLGVEFAVPDLAIVLGRSVTDLIAAVDEACAGGVLTESGTGLGFRHPLIRAALYDDIPAPMRAAWHRTAGRALAEAGAPADRVARQLQAAAGIGGAAEPADEWMLDWLAAAADSLIGRAPAVAAELLTRAVATIPAGSARHGWFASRLADALYRTGDLDRAEEVATRALQYAGDDPDLMVDLHWTLVQRRMQEDMSDGCLAASIAILDEALATPALQARHRGRLLVLAARLYCSIGRTGKAVPVATSALAAAEEAGDHWAAGWSLHVLALAAAMQGDLAGALPLFSRALAATQTDPALADLRILLLVNQAVVLGYLDQIDAALATAREALSLADQVGTTIRVTQAHGALSQLLYSSGRWDDALAQAGIIPDQAKEPSAAVSDLGIAAVICFHRSEPGTARQHLAAAGPYADRVGSRFIGVLALARSLDREQAGALPEALEALTAGFNTAEDLEGGEEVLADAVRLAVETGDLSTARTLMGYASALADGSEVPHRQAAALYCRGLLTHDATCLLAAAACYDDAARPLLSAQALEAAAGQFILAGDQAEARAAFTSAVDTYDNLGAAADVARVQAEFRPHGIRRGPHVKHRRVRSGWDSLTPTEMKVAAFVEEGLTNTEIAARLILSRSTIATHISHILEKLGVHSRTEIAREAALRAITAR